MVVRRWPRGREAEGGQEWAFQAVRSINRGVREEQQRMIGKPQAMCDFCNRARSGRR